MEHIEDEVLHDMCAKDNGLIQKLADGRDDIFKSSWFAYETMANFLQPVYSARNTINTKLS
nr:unnamed protein product [Callosobruchus analis]